MCVAIPGMSDAEVVFWIDDDVTWSPGSLERLIEKALETKGIVAGVVACERVNAGRGALQQLGQNRVQRFGEIERAEFTMNRVDVGFA